VEIGAGDEPFALLVVRPEILRLEDLYDVLGPSLRAPLYDTLLDETFDEVALELGIRATTRERFMTAIQEDGAKQRRGPVSGVRVGADTDC
jgi:hypothetical protein